MDPLTLIAKLLGATWKVGAAMAVVAGVIFYGRQEGISIFVNLNDGLFQTIIVAGLIGAATVAVELLVAFARFVRWLGSRIAQFTAGGSARTESKTKCAEHAVVDIRIRRSFAGDI
jgi:hypothetical protein